MKSVAGHVEQRPHRIRRGAAAISVLLVAGLTCSILYAWERSPIHCNNGCLVQSPVIDPLTKQFLESALAPIDGWVPMWMFATGTSYRVCNATHCADYRQTFEGKYVTDARIPIDPRPGPAPGNGGGGGGLAPGGGPGWSGVVEIGPISKPPGGEGFPPGTDLVPCKFGGSIRWVPRGGCDF